MGQAIAKYGKDNGYALARAVTDSQVAQCESEINARWLDKISNIDVYSASNCQTALTYFQFDVGPDPTIEVAKAVPEASFAVSRLINQASRR